MEEEKKLSVQGKIEIRLEESHTIKGKESHRMGVRVGNSLTEGRGK